MEKGHDTDNQFYRVTEGGIEQATESGTEWHTYLLCGIAEQLGERHDREKVEGEHGQRAPVEPLGRHAQGHKQQQPVGGGR